MVSAELKEIFSHLDRRQITEVKAYLAQTYRSTTDEDRMRYNKYLKMAEEIWGVKSNRARTSENVWIRTMVSYAMKRDGVSTLAIANCMGLNHTSVCNYLNKVHSIESYPAMYFDIIERWDRFKEKIKKEN